ncbi:glycosyltransferase [Pontibacter sp. H249]|uniref:glycosyltransferase n=1 Tax=Pontibacter sp. H249 TaxID=3133420 RepID=UPI0030C08C2E
MDNITQEVLDVCVLVPYYNNIEGLRKSLNSIEYHTGKFLVLVVDDGSNTPLTKAEAMRGVNHPVPLHIIKCSVNGGITKAMNTGLRWIQKNLKVKYIARLDCGDVCRSDRFYKQVEFLYANTETGLLGCWCKFETEDGTLSYNYTTPTDHQQILKEMHLRNVFIHPGVIFRSELIESVGSYPEGYEYVEDYAFFWNILNVSKGAVIADFLVTCEINKGGISISKRKLQLLARKRIVKVFGTNYLMKQLGIAKLRLLLLIPYNFILKTKALITKY